MATNRWLGGVVPRTAARTPLESRGFFAKTKKEARTNLTQPELRKLMEKATIGMETKFALLGQIRVDDSDSLKDVYDLNIRIEEFIEELRSYDLDDCFLIPDAFDVGTGNELVPSPGADPVNLFHAYGSIELELVRESSTWMMKYGQDYHVQNLIWSGTKVLNSCEQELREKVEESVKDFEIEERTGPVYFKLMADCILSSSTQSMRSVARKLEDMSLGEFEGENVAKAVSIIRGAISLLQNNASLPSDILDMIFKIMKTSSTPDFTQYVATIETNHLTGVKRTNVEELLLELQKRYLDLTANMNWVTGASNRSHGSAFITCYNCGKEGHIAKDCWSAGGGGRGRGRGGRGGRGFGRGRGRGRGRGFGRGGRGRSRTRVRGFGQRNPLRIPPGNGDSHTRTRNGVVEHWCGRCGLWTNHKTTEHVTFVGVETENRNSNQSEYVVMNEDQNDSVVNGVTDFNLDFQ